ncbi:hypothetical protein TNCV_3868661 [Trichonephila clavipes]|nr:hypothetical protein TNCV_3868661 [Trichonephila clavipes]
MDVCKCIVPLRHGGTLNSRRAASPLVWLVEGVERWEAPDHPQMSLKFGVETSQIVLSPGSDARQICRELKRPSVGMVRQLGEGCQLRCRYRHLTMVQNDEVRRQKPSCS